MFNPIRKLIAENKIAQALAACAELELTPAGRSQLISLRRRWSMLADEDIAQTREQRLLKLEGNAVVDDLLKWLDQLEYAPAKEEWSVKVTHSKQGGGAAAGAEKAPEKGRAKWLWLGAALIALIAATWMFWPAADPAARPNKAEVTREATEGPATETPATNTPTRPGKTTSKPGDLTVVDPSKVNPERVILNPNVRLNPEALKKLAATNSLMTAGEQVGIAVAVYRNARAPTKHDPELTKSLAAFLAREASGMKVAGDVLTQKFHDHEKRDRLQIRAVFDAEGLSASRARFLLLADVRNVNSQGKGELRLCLYDVARGKGFTRGKSIEVGAGGRTGAALKEKELYYAARDYLKEMKERGILK